MKNYVIVAIIIILIIIAVVWYQAKTPVVPSGEDMTPTEDLTTTDFGAVPGEELPVEVAPVDEVVEEVPAE